MKTHGVNTSSSDRRVHRTLCCWPTPLQETRATPADLRHVHPQYDHLWHPNSGPTLDDLNFWSFRNDHLLRHIRDENLHHGHEVADLFHDAPLKTVLADQPPHTQVLAATLWCLPRYTSGIAPRPWAQQCLVHRSRDSRSSESSTVWQQGSM